MQLAIDSPLIQTQKTIIPVLSVRQPWAWLLVNGRKDIENRNKKTKYRGYILIHAGKLLAKDFYPQQGLVDINDAPRWSVAMRGGIVGIAEITDCVTESDSKWFFGKYGYVIKNAKPLPFQPCDGQVNFFRADVPASYNDVIRQYLASLG